MELASALHSDQYFSSYGAVRNPAQSPSILDRIRSHLAWRLDGGQVRNPEFYTSLAGSRSARICDLGCGNGGLIELLARYGFQVVGVEPSPFARDNVRSKGLKVHEGTAEDLPGDLPRTSFDLVLMNHVLEHCQDPALAVGNALGLVRDGGRVVIEVPNCDSFQFATRGPTWFHFDVGRHVNYFTPRALARLLERQGAVVETHYYYAYLDHFLPERLDIEAAIWDRRHAEGPGENLAGVPRPSRTENWMSLFRSARLRPQHKYECQGIVARKG
jgi:SAM-dependent methyltransferase